LRIESNREKRKVDFSRPPPIIKVDSLEGKMIHSRRDSASHSAALRSDAHYRRERALLPFAVLVCCVVAGAALLSLTRPNLTRRAYVGAHSGEEEQEGPSGKRISFSGLDALAHKGEEVVLKAKLETRHLRRDIEQEPVECYVDGALIGQARTDEEGFASFRFTPGRLGDFEVEYRLSDASGYLPKSARGLLAVRDERRPVLVSDLDYTLIDMSTYRFFDHDNQKIPPFKGAPEGMTKLAREYDVIYLTARDDIYLNVTKEWLAMYEFPKAPLFFCDLSEDPVRQGAYKQEALKALKERWGNLTVGVGDKAHDARAYLANGMQAYILGDHDELPEGAIPVKDWDEVVKLLGKKETPLE
jgi:hypothetical protein